MASAFWTLEDGRGFATRWTWVAYMLKLITNELKYLEGAEEFHQYLEWFVYKRAEGDEYNGYGGFIRNSENVMFNFDLRTFAPSNRDYFWKATQNAMNKLKANPSESDEGIILSFTTLLDMHKRIQRGEDPMELNHMRIIEPDPQERMGPGW